MKRLFRHLFTLCAAVSLLLCIAVCVLWVTSATYYRPLESDSPRVMHGWGWNGGRIGYYNLQDVSQGTTFTLKDNTRTLPLWTAVALFAMLPTAFAGWWLSTVVLAQRRKRLGLCPQCGYDLRASPQGGRCPECGAMVSSQMIEHA